MLVITGLMRSGTSPLARMAHQSGIVMGSTHVFSGPGMEAEYEDYDLIGPLAYDVMGVCLIKDPEDVFRRYIRKRRGDAKLSKEIFGAEHVKGWGVKSPYLSLFWGDLKRAAKVEGESLKVVLTYRPLSEVQKSMDLCLSHIRACHRKQYQEKFGWVQSRMREARASVREDADLEISLSETRGSPITAARKIAALMEIELENEYVVVHGIY